MRKKVLLVLAFCFAVFGLCVAKDAYGNDLKEVKKRGVLRHLGIPYANFVTGSNDGLDVELMRLFAKHLKVKYQYVPATWNNVFQSLLGKKYEKFGDNVHILGDQLILGDVIANGLTILPWREKLVTFSKPTFPSQIWVVTRADFDLEPVQPTGNLMKDIEQVKAKIKPFEVMGKDGTCLETKLYGLETFVRKTFSFPGDSLGDMAAYLIQKKTDIMIYDSPDAMVALTRWPGQIKIIGPLTEPQEMGVGFRKNSLELRDEFNKFYQKIQQDETYKKLVDKYYPSVLHYFPEFFVRS